MWTPQQSSVRHRDDQVLNREQLPAYCPRSGEHQPRSQSPSRQLHGKQAGVVDQNSIFVIGANYLIDQFENKYGDSKITNVSFKAADKT